MSTGEISVPVARGALFAALAKAQAKIRTAAKDSKNPHFNSKYADLASVAEACREALTENGICVLQDPSTEGNQVKCVTTLGHSSGESYESKALSMVPRDLSPQSVGSCVTYLRRYQLASVVGVAPDDDDGNAAQGSAGPKGDAGGVKAAAPRAQEAAPAVGKERSAAPISNTAGTASTESATPTEHPTSKPPRADTIPHDSVFASDIQVARLVELATKAATHCKGGCGVAVKQYSKRAGATVDKTKLCTYHTQLAAFKGPGGEPCGSPNELSVTQIDNLLQRYESKLQRQEARADKGVDLEAVVPTARPPTVEELLGKVDDDVVLQDDWLEGHFGVRHVQELQDEEVKTALALLGAMGTDRYDNLESVARSTGRIR